MNDKILLYIEKAASVFCSEENTSAHADFVDIKVYCEVRAAAKPVKLFCIVPEGVLVAPVCTSTSYFACNCLTCQDFYG